MCFRQIDTNLGGYRSGYYGDTEAYLRSCRVLERQIGKFQDMHTEYGNAFEVLGYELEELYADMAVAKTGNYHN